MSRTLVLLLRTPPQSLRNLCALCVSAVKKLILILARSWRSWRSWRFRLLSRGVDDAVHVVYLDGLGEHYVDGAVLAG